jgi:hypothetical protein
VAVARLRLAGRCSGTTVVECPGTLGGETLVELTGGIDAAVAARATSATVTVPSTLAIAAAQVRIVTRR